jgi:hypothetical protein
MVNPSSTKEPIDQLPGFAHFPCPQATTTAPNPRKIVFGFIEAVSVCQPMVRRMLGTVQLKTSNAGRNHSQRNRLGRFFAAPAVAAELSIARV